MRWERIDLTSSSSSPATRGKTWGQRQRWVRRSEMTMVAVKQMRAYTIQACLSLNSYQSLLIPCGLRARDGGLADGLADGLSLKLRTRCLSIAILVPLSFQPVGLNFYIPLKIDEECETVKRFGFEHKDVWYTVCNTFKDTQYYTLTGTASIMEKRKMAHSQNSLMKNNSLVDS